MSERLPITAARIASPTNAQCSLMRSRKTIAAARLSMVSGQAIWNPHSAFWYCTNESITMATGQ